MMAENNRSNSAIDMPPAGESAGDSLLSGVIGTRDQRSSSLVNSKATDAMELSSNILETGSSRSEVDGRARRTRANQTQTYDIHKGIAESAMDISLLTANANQLRLLITYNQGSKTYVACITFIIISLVLQMMVAISMIVVSLTKPQRDDPRWKRVKIITSVGVALITMINILVASLVVTEQPPNAIVATSGNVIGMLTNVNLTHAAI